MLPPLKGQFRIAGALGTGLAAGLTSMHVFADVKGAAGKVVVKAVTRKFFQRALRNVARRVGGHLIRESRAWQKAFAHIAEQHFSEQAEKLVNGVFLSKFRNQESIEQLLREAVRGAQRRTVLPAGHPDNTSGRAVIRLEIQFFEKIVGEKFVQLTKDDAGRMVPCKFLRIFLDVTGRPITMFPVTGFK
jgi:hypothetical protein